MLPTSSLGPQSSCCTRRSSAANSPLGTASEALHGIHGTFSGVSGVFLSGLSSHPTAEELHDKEECLGVGRTSPRPFRQRENSLRPPRNSSGLPQKSLAPLLFEKRVSNRERAAVGWVESSKKRLPGARHVQILALKGQ